MEYLHELIALSVDGLILGLCLKEYFSYKNTLDVLKVCNLQYLYFNNFSSAQIKVIFFYYLCQVAKQYSIDENLKEIIKQSRDGKINYGIIRGTVKPIGQPIHSVMSPSVTGVLQVIKLRLLHANTKN